MSRFVMCAAMETLENDRFENDVEAPTSFMLWDPDDKYDDDSSISGSITSQKATTDAFQ